MDITAKVAFLRRPESYPDRPRSVEVIETHMSWVFLADSFVYKLKKPVRYPFLDFRTIDARHHDSVREVELNRRLAPDVYLGVVPLAVGSDGSLSLAGKGRVVDWLVHMRRLPRDRMLDEVIRREELDRPGIHAVGHLLSRFYRERRPVEIAPAEYRCRFADDIDEYLRELSDPQFELPVERIERLCHLQYRFIEHSCALLDGRVAAGRIIEGHGDLRPQHVCLTEPPVVIDCLEFNREFRILDAADELGYLGLECERFGTPWAAGELFAVYADVTGDRAPEALVHFYQSFRALLRAKIAVWHNRDDNVRHPGRWIVKAMDYIELAERHTERLA